ncbi:MAG: hypothetical protein OSJ62_16145 [Lachnospiraceae bacterium]|nr:hypothetical protein [Lachnospiraceae bacterium]
MDEFQKFPKKEIVLRWAGWIICVGSGLAVILLFFIKFILKQEAYLSDMLIFAGIALFGYKMANWYKRVQEDQKNEQ